MKQINMLESPVRQVFFSYLVPSISATRSSVRSSMS